LNEGLLLPWRDWEVGAEQRGAVFLRSLISLSGISFPRFLENKIVWRVEGEHRIAGISVGGRRRAETRFAGRSLSSPNLFPLLRLFLSFLLPLSFLSFLSRFLHSCWLLSTLFGQLQIGSQAPSVSRKGFSSSFLFGQEKRIRSGRLIVASRQGRENLLFSSFHFFLPIMFQSSHLPTSSVFLLFFFIHLLFFSSSSSTTFVLLPGVAPPSLLDL